MNPHTIDARVLIVEDDKLQARGIKNDLNKISREKREPLGIGHFVCEIAGSVSEAQNLLSEVKGASFDLLLLDLGLPLSKGGEFEKEDIGFEILKLVQETGAAKEVIIVSVFDKYEYVRRAFRGGALDFLAKPYKRAELQSRVLECWRRILADKCARILEQRIQRLVPYDENELAHRFSAQFSSLIQNVVYGAEEIKRELSERWGIDAKRDEQDSLLRYLAELERAVKKTRQEWTQLQASLTDRSEQSNKYVLQTLLENIREDLLPCLKVKNVELGIQPVPDARVISFQEDVPAVLKEIIVGALTKLPNYGKQVVRIDTTITTEEDYAKVRFSGSPMSIKPEASANIKRGKRLRGKDFGQEWGLSIAQHVALRGGGRLQIGGDENPESITYVIPRARHD